MVDLGFFYFNTDSPNIIRHVRILNSKKQTQTKSINLLSKHFF